MKFLSLLLLFTSVSFGKSLSHQEWVDYFRSRDLNTQLELDRLSSANLQIKERLGRILPSLNLGTLIEIAVSGPIGVVGNLSNLIGFMLPSRWFEWDESKMYYLSQYYSYMAMRGNAILAAEDIYLSLKKSYLIDGVLEEQFNLISPLVKTIDLREKMGELPLGTSARVKTKLLELQNDRTQFDYMINQYLVEMNRLILDKSLGEIDSIQFRARRPRMGTLDWEFEKVLENSVELKSFEALLVASNFSKRARNWGFLDFSGEGFGLGYFARNSRSTLELDYLEKKKDEASLQIKANFKNLNLEEEYLVEQSDTLLLSRKVLKKRLKEIIEHYKITGELHADNFIETLDSSMKTEVLFISNNTQKEFLIAQKERILLEGFYLNLDDNIPERDLSKLKRYQKREDKLIKKEN